MFLVIRTSFITAFIFTIALQIPSADAHILLGLALRLLMLLIPPVLFVVSITLMEPTRAVLSAKCELVILITQIES
jgi:hypothetical protein